MKIAVTLIVLSGVVVVATGFQPVIQSSRRCTTRAFSWNEKNEDDSSDVETLFPETSFGSESVPEAQRPVNEYLDVTKQPMFGWASLGNRELLTRLVILYSVVFAVVCYPISGATFTQDGYLLQKLAASNVGAILLVLVALLRIYSGWAYIGSRLSSKVVEFEETGWYDGAMERKTETEFKRDKMIYTSTVKPVVQRLQTFTAGAAALSLASVLALNVAVSTKPLFNEYDPEMLSRLRYDEKLAETAASNSAGRPTYCDSRYYRAVAGGQGCD